MLAENQRSLTQKLISLRFATPEPDSRPTSLGILVAGKDPWQERIPKNPAADLALPKGKMQPIGYVILQHGVRFDRPVKAFQRWIERIPHIYSGEVLQEPNKTISTPSTDPNRLALLKHYQSLMPMAQESYKPIFKLKPADGAIGAHIDAVKLVYWDFKDLAQKIADRTELSLPNSQLTEDRFPLRQSTWLPLQSRFLNTHDRDQSGRRDHVQGIVGTPSCHHCRESTNDCRRHKQSWSIRVTSFAEWCWRGNS